MPRVSYEDYETEVYVNVSPEWDEEIDVIYDSCSDDEKREFMRMAIAEGFSEDEEIEEALNELRNRNGTLTRQLRELRDAQQTPPEIPTDVEKLTEALVDAPIEQLHGLPDELINVLKQKLDGVEGITYTPAPSAKPEATSSQNESLEQLKLLAQLHESSDPICTEMRLLIQNL